jgi:hypothetical protein
MKNLMHTLFLSCLKATEMIEKKLHFKLSSRERLQLRMHKMMCTACSLYEKQSAFLETGISLSPGEDYSPEELKELKLIISEKLSDIK